MTRSWAVEQRKIVDFDELLKYPSVKKWYESLSEGDSRDGSLYRFAAFLRWREKIALPIDPEEWVRECLLGNNLTLIKHLDVIKDYCEGESFDGDADSTRQKNYKTLRSFYAKNRVPLPREKLSLNREGEKEVEIPLLVTATVFLEMASKVVNYTGISVRDRSIIMTNIQTGMDASTLAKVFNRVAFPQLVKHFQNENWQDWDATKTPVRIDLMRPKTDYFYYTFIDHDAVLCLKDWLNVRLSNFGRIKIYQPLNPKQLPTSDPIYLADYGSAINSPMVTRIFTECGKMAGVNVVPEMEFERYQGAKIRYPYHSHEVRDTLVTLHRRCGVDKPVVDFLVGHDIDKDGYDKDPWDNPDWFRDQYAKLTKYLNLISGKESRMREEIKGDYEKELESVKKELAENRQTMKEILERLRKGAKTAPDLMDLKGEDLA